MPDYLPPPGTHPLNAVGVHIYAGGFTLGAVNHFNVLAHLEAGAYGLETIEANFPGLKVYSPENEWPVASLANECVHCIYGNPPCAPFSINNKSDTHWTDDPRVNDIKNQFALLSRIRPNVWIWESVQPAYKKGRPLVDELANKAMDLGYAVSFVLFDAQWLGIPQRRRRFFFVAHNVELPWHLSEITAEPPRVGEVLDSIPEELIGEPFHEAFKRHAYLIPHTPPGKSLRVAFDQMMEDGKIERELNKMGQIKGRPSWGGVRLDGEGVAPTMVGYGWAHPYEDRPLSLVEMQVLTTFPPEYEFVGTGPTSLMARGVLPKVADWLMGIVAQGILADRPVEPQTFEVDIKKPVVRVQPLRRLKQLDIFPDQFA